jgi:hypothetical protein
LKPDPKQREEKMIREIVLELKSLRHQIQNCTVEKLGSRRSPLTIEGVGQHLEGGFLEEVGGLAGQQG